MTIEQIKEKVEEHKRTLETTAANIRQLMELLDNMADASETAASLLEDAANTLATATE